MVLAMVPFGLIVGSILSMVAARVPDELPVFTPGPHCPGCEHQLSASELIPVVSWIRQGRSCVHCDAQISAAYPVIEIVTATLFALFALKFGASWFLLPHLVFGAALVALSVTDLYLYRIPDRIVFPALGACLVMIVAISFGMGRPEMIATALAGMAIYFAVLFVVWFIYPPGIGFGDVKLALLLGLFLGWTPMRHVEALGDELLGGVIVTGVFSMYALFLGCVLFAIMSVGIIIARSRGIDLLPDPLEDEYMDDDTDDTEFDDTEFEDADYELERGSQKVHTGAPMGPALAIGTLIILFFPGTFV